MQCKLLPENERFRIGGTSITKIYIIDKDRRCWNANELHDTRPRRAEVLRMEPEAERLLSATMLTAIIVIITHIIMWLT
ncbi:hypothetical protein ES708_14735 [subsurface metagenome]